MLLAFPLLASASGEPTVIKSAPGKWLVVEDDEGSICTCRATYGHLLKERGDCPAPNQQHECVGWYGIRSDESEGTCDQPFPGCNKDPCRFGMKGTLIIDDDDPNTPTWCCCSDPNSDREANGSGFGGGTWVSPDGTVFTPTFWLDLDTVGKSVELEAWLSVLCDENSKQKKDLKFTIMCDGNEVAHYTKVVFCRKCGE